MCFIVLAGPFMVLLQIAEMWSNKPLLHRMSKILPADKDAGDANAKGFSGTCRRKYLKSKWRLVSQCRLMIVLGRFAQHRSPY